VSFGSVARNVSVALGRSVVSGPITRGGAAEAGLDAESGAAGAGGVAVPQAASRAQARTPKKTDLIDGIVLRRIVLAESTPKSNACPRGTDGLTANNNGGNMMMVMNTATAAQLQKIVKPYADDIALVAGELARRGWAEANAGNISVRLSDGPILSSLLVKRANTRMRDLARNPTECLCLLTFGAGDRSYSVLPKGTQPSSELPTHVAVHDMLARFRHHDRVVVHTHPTALISLTHRFQDQKRLVRMLLGTCTEAPVLLQDRLTAIPFLPPGSSSLGRATATALEQFSAVIWPGHGIVAVGPTAASALDLVELAGKAAQIALTLGSHAGLSPAQQKAVRRAARLE